MELKVSNMDVKRFMEVLDQCTGNVYLETPEGDRYNLKSKLSQMMGLFHIIEGAKLVDAKIVCDNPEDESLIFRANLFG